MNNKQCHSTPLITLKLPLEDVMLCVTIIRPTIIRLNLTIRQMPRCPRGEPPLEPPGESANAMRDYETMRYVCLHRWDSIGEIPAKGRNGITGRINIYVPQKTRKQSGRGERNTRTSAMRPKFNTRLNYISTHAYASVICENIENTFQENFSYSSI